jgi:hypothetical protein
MAKGVRFEWNGTKQQIIARKGFGRNLNREFARIALEHMQKYTPYDPNRKSGIHMSDNTELRNVNDNDNSVAIVYKAPYTRKQYYSKYHPMSEHSPLATDHWDKYCWELERSEITAEVEAARERFAK